MLIEFLYELKESVDKHGIRWGVIFALYAVYRKERRNMRLDQRDEAVFHNQRVIMEHLGVMDQWHGPVKISSWDRSNYKRLFSLSRQEASRGNLLRRKKIMGKIVQNLSSKKIWVFLLLVILNGLNDTLQLNLSPEAINNITQGGTVYIVIQGVVDAVLAYVKKKGNEVSVNEPTQSTNTIGSNK